MKRIALLLGRSALARRYAAVFVAILIGAAAQSARASTGPKWSDIHCFRVGQQFVTNGNCYQQVRLHEMGHALGLGHTGVTNAVMFASVGFAQCSASPLPLHPDDMAGAQAIYPQNTPGGAPGQPTNVQTQNGMTTSNPPER